MFGIFKSPLSYPFNVEYFLNRVKGALGLTIGDYLLGGLFSYSGEGTEKPGRSGVEIYLLFYRSFIRKGKTKVYPLGISSTRADDISYLYFRAEKVDPWIITIAAYVELDFIFLHGREICT